MGRPTAFEVDAWDTADRHGWSRGPTRFRAPTGCASEPTRSPDGASQRPEGETSLRSAGVRIPVVDLSEPVDRVAVELDRSGQDEFVAASRTDSRTRLEFLRASQTAPSPAGIAANRTQADITETF